VTNKLYYGDNLEVLREHIADESIDLIYLDPPFNSNASYSILFKTPQGQGADAQIEAFNDTWTWGPAASSALMDITQSGNHALHTLMQAMKTAIGENAMMAYLAMMAVRLVELHRVLKPTGSLYLHCDPTASHYLKLVLDAVFGPENFINEISWRRTTAKSDYQQGAKHFPRVRDTIFRYVKDARQDFTFNQVFAAYSQDYIDAKYASFDESGRRYMLDNLTGPGGAAKGNAHYEVMGVERYWRYSKENMDRLIAEGRVVQPSPGAVPRYKRYLDEMPGVATGDDWDDIRPINSQAQERLGYPTQKPVALLERIISASSKIPATSCSTPSAAAAPRSTPRRSSGGSGSASMSPISPSVSSRSGCAKAMATPRNGRRSVRPKTSPPRKSSPRTTRTSSRRGSRSSSAAGRGWAARRAATRASTDTSIMSARAARPRPA
jgi:adenine specific DNA methylase Mod